MGYLNKHHTDVLTAFAETFSELGAIQTKRNSYSGGSYKIVEAKIVSIDYPSKQMELEVTVNERGKKEPTIQQVPVSLGKQSVVSFFDLRAQAHAFQFIDLIIPVLSLSLPLPLTHNNNHLNIYLFI